MKVERVEPGMIVLCTAPAICESLGSLKTFWSYSCTTMYVCLPVAYAGTLSWSKVNMSGGTRPSAYSVRCSCSTCLNFSSNTGAFLASKTGAPSEYHSENRLHERLAHCRCQALINQNISIFTLRRHT